MTTVVLDNEAVQALTAVTHPKHRRALAHVEAVVVRRRRGRPPEIVVPTAVRVEAGWDRSEPAAALANRLRITDAALDGGAANVAARLATVGSASSVADAHVGATVAGLPQGEVVVLTSDPVDMAAVCHPRPVRIIRL